MDFNYGYETGYSAYIELLVTASDEFLCDLYLQRMFETEYLAEVDALLCHSPAHRDVIYPVIHPIVQCTTHSLWQDLMLLNGTIPTIPATNDCQKWLQKQLNDYLQQLDICIKPHCERSLDEGTVLHGEDIGDLPTTYTVQNLLPHELPVIGEFMSITIYIRTNNTLSYEF